MSTQIKTAGMIDVDEALNELNGNPADVCIRINHGDAVAFVRRPDAVDSVTVDEANVGWEANVYVPIVEARANIITYDVDTLRSAILQAESAELVDYDSDHFVET